MKKIEGDFQLLTDFVADVFVAGMEFLKAGKCIFFQRFGIIVQGQQL